jgi:hypothetical protein
MMPAWLPDWVAVIGGILAILALLLGGITVVVKLMVDARVRAQMEPFVESIEIELTTIRHNQASLSTEVAELTVHVQNGLTDKMETLASQVTAIYNHLLQ